MKKIMDSSSDKDEGCFVENLEDFLLQSIKILKKLVESIEKSEKFNLKQREDLMEFRMNDAIFHLNNEIDQVREMIPLSKIDNCVSNLHDLDHRISRDINHMKNAIGKSASHVIVERDIQNIEKEFNVKINKILERLTRNEKIIRLQTEKMYFDLYQVLNDSLTARLEKKMSSMTPSGDVKGVHNSTSNISSSEIHQE